MKYPLQTEIEKDFQEAVKLFASTQINGSALEKEIAQRYYNAIERINDICVNRKRY